VVCVQKFQVVMVGLQTRGHLRVKELMLSSPEGWEARKEDVLTEDIEHEEQMESITKEEAPLATADRPTAKSKLYQTNNPNKSNQEITKESGKPDNSNLEHDNNNQDNNSKPNAKKEEETPEDKEDSEEAIIPVREVDSKEWQQIHDEWLHMAMWAGMGDRTLMCIPAI